MPTTDPGRSRYEPTLPSSGVKHSRLLARLDALRELPMVWVSGCAGAGKSTLLASYLQARAARAIWWQIDASCADPCRAFDSLAHAAQAAGTSIGSLPAWAPAHSRDPASFARLFFSELFAGTADSILVMDNLERAPELGLILRDVLEEIPPGASIIVASRVAPPAALARSVAHGRIGRIEEEELRLTEGESAEIAAAWGNVDREAAVALHRYCCGWPAGLAMALRNFQRGRPIPSPSTTELVHDYFGAEVFDLLKPRECSLLMQTAPLPVFTRAMAGSIAGSDAQAILDELRRQSCFIVRDEGTDVYRYHDLFREFLIARLDRDLPPGHAREIRGKCARTLAEAGQIGDALELYAQISDIEALKRLIVAHAGTLYRAGQWQTLAQWIALVPADEIEADGWLLHWHATVLTSSSPVEAQRRFTRAYRKFQQDEDQSGQFIAAIGAIEAVLARVDRYADLDEWIRALEPQMSRAAEIGDPAVRARAWYAFLQSTLLRRPDHPLIETGIAWLRESLHATRLSPAETVSAGAVLMFYACLAADDAVAHETATLSGEAAHRDDLSPVARWTWHYWYGLFWLWRLEYEHAVQCWEHCTRISEQSGLGALDWLVHGNLVMVDLAEDRFEQAERRMVELRRAGAAGHMNAYALYWMAETFLRLYRQRSDLPEAIKAMVECARITGFFNLEMLCLSDAAAVHLLRGEDDAAAALVEEVGARVAGTVVTQSNGQVVALRAGLLYRAGRIEEAHRTFAQALDLVARGGSCGCMLWVRAGLSTLFGAALQVSRHVPLVRDLVRRYQVPAPARAGEEWPWPVRIHSLGQFRIEVDDAPVPFGRKAQQKVLELLKALIAEGAKEVDGGMVADWLWPDVDGDAAQSNLRGTVKRLRELLGHPESVRLFDGKISLNERICWLDLWVFREWCAALLDGAVASGQHAEPTRQVQSLYRGPLLTGEDAPWLQPARRRERQRIGRVLARLSTHDEPVASRLRAHALLVDPELAAV